MQDWGFIASVENFVSEIPNLAYTQPLAVIKKKMKQLKYIAIIGILLLNRCSSWEGYELQKNFKSIVNNENCQVEYYYPKFTSNHSELELTELNALLEKYADYENYAHRCDEKVSEKRIIKGDYNITLKTKDKLSIEFITEFIHFGGKRLDTIYHSIVLNPKKIGDKEFSFFQPDPTFIIPNFDRGDLYKYVEVYNSKNRDKINLLAYESGSNYVITWGISENDFLLYVGGEGEWFGNDKIRIPINELTKENNR